MSRYDRNGALSEDFVESFMNEMASDVLIFSREQPNYERYRAASEAWHETLARLDRSLFEAFDDEVTDAFSEYDKILGEFLWVSALIDATRGIKQSASDVAQCGDIPGLKNAEQQLADVCKEFCDKLEPEYKLVCIENMKGLKEKIDDNRYCYYLHGWEFTRTLLERVEINPKT